jgi:hypothetical protein
MDAPTIRGISNSCGDGVVVAGACVVVVLITNGIGGVHGCMFLSQSTSLTQHTFVELSQKSSEA